jgi:hypothetical protein
MQERVVREIRTLRAMWRALETEPYGVTAPVLDPTTLRDRHILEGQISHLAFTPRNQQAVQFNLKRFSADIARATTCLTRHTDNALFAGFGHHKPSKSGF